MSCVFCSAPSEAGDVVFDDGRVFVVLHHDWAVRGHAMVVWTEHVENVADLAASDWLHLATVHHHAERALLAATGAKRAVLMKLGIATPHLHLHIYPVAASLDRAAVMEIIDSKVRHPYDGAFVEEMRKRLT